MTAWTLFRMGKLMETRNQVETNQQRVSNIRRTVAEINRELDTVEKEIAELEEDHQMLHDHITDENHCGSPNCRFCEHHQEQEFGVETAE